MSWIRTAVDQFGFVRLSGACLFFVCLAAGAAGAEPDTETAGPVTTLDQAIRMAMEHNFEIARAALGPQEAEAKLDEAWSVFEPRLTGGGEYSDKEFPTGSALGGASVVKSREFNYDIGLTQRLLTGAEYDVRWGVDRLKTNSLFASLNPSVASDFTVSLSQPLLRGFGTDVNRTAIVVARHNRAISSQQHRDTVIRLLTEVETAYWELARTTDDMSTLQASEATADDLVSILERQLKAGKREEIALLEAKTDQAAAKEARIAQQAKVETVRDRLLNLIDPTGQDSQLNRELVAQLPSAAPERVADSSPLERLALEQRPDLKQAKARLKSNQAQKREADNRLLPTFNLVTSMSLNGIGGNGDASYDNLSTTRNSSYTVGFVVEIPLGNKQARSRSRLAKLAVRQEELSISHLRYQIMLEAREAVRQVNSSVDRLGPATVASTLAQKVLTATRASFVAGRATARDVIEKKEVANRSRGRLNGARVAYYQARATLARVTGQTLTHHGVKMADPAP